MVEGYWGGLRGYEGERLGQGREKARDYLRENRDVLAKIESQVRERAASKRQGAANNTPVDAGGDADEGEE